ncbi:glycine--tRNA ligase subunit beta [Terriglobus tenax]|uniref:glycine--tRNA ligase subunit beta n=1 Tax=Terriglobus tenax TaxID=1111115 RepID=UPI0021DF9374|nr:glycine--tRNA ligase subunit beta [Terriglobus tenax]
MADFLFEIGLEEVPARMIASAEAELTKRVNDLLGRERLLEEGSSVTSYSTPRRLAVVVSGVLRQQPDAVEELLGPSLKVAFKDGQPTAAAEAFAKKAGVSVTDLSTVTNAKGEYLGATVKRAGKSASDVIAAELPKEIAGIYWAKNMFWRAGKPERFVRPVKWMVALLDEAVVPVEFAGVTAGNTTRGHRILHGSGTITIAKPVEYVAALEKAFVIADVAVRRQKIRKDLDKVTRTVAGARWREDEELVETVTHLTEWPYVILGGFEQEYLELPEEVLVTVMRDHQKYFAVEDAGHKLAAHFLAVLNIEPDAEGLEIIRTGNERVLRARFNDARFFWEFDQKTPLVDRVESLKNVTFQKELGSYFAKAERVRKVASSLARLSDERKTAVDAAALEEAATIAKTDLTSELVKEFTELQGIVGGLYARAQGLSETVALAVYDQYLPASMEDAIPRTVEGLLLSIADKADTIGGMFGLGLEPTGSKDPFGLRRAANGIVKMLAEAKLPVLLSEIAGLGSEHAATATKVEGFFAERVEFYLKDVKGYAYDVVKAVLAAGADDVPDAVARAQAVTDVRGSEDFAAVSAAFKRMRNILTQAREKGEAAAWTPDFLVEPAERTLAEESGRLAAWVEGQRREKHYVEALQSIATLRPHVDDFFEKVMVMAPEEKLRAARLGLLNRVLQDFSRVADFSEIVVSS